ncbi:MAG: hypothetical protein Q8Q33_00155 [Chlamydiota bacterium]|nr:hypothetical protein [Chlamydiota bacterium]
MNKIRFCIVFSFFLLLIQPISAMAEELTLKDGSSMAYQSVFSMDEEGVSLQVENGITHIPWQNLLEKDANILSQGKYKKWILERQKRLEAQQKAKESRKLQKQTTIEPTEDTLENTPEEIKSKSKENTQKQEEDEEEWQPSSYRYM